jgi:DHA2 family multidrug resistance protein-like MFS transporter
VTAPAEADAVLSDESSMNRELPPKASRREWLGLAIIALPCLLYSMDLTVLHLAVPALSADLRPTSAELLWIIDIYGFMVAGSLMTMGTIGDRIGRRRLLLAGAAAFGAASVVAAFCRSPATLIAARALLGLAGATVAPSTLSLIRSMFQDPAERTTAISVWITSYSLGGALGPVLGGLLLAHYHWSSVFLISVPVMLLVLLLGPWLLPEYRDPNAGRPDLPSAALSLAAVLSVIYGLKQLAQDGLSLAPLAVIGCGALIGAAFVRRQRGLTDPLIDLRLFRLPRFSASLFAYGFGIFVLFGGFLFLPQYLQLVHGLAPQQAGLWTVPWALAFVVGSLITPMLSRKLRPATLMCGGLVLAAAGFATLALLDESTSFVSFAATTALFSLGLSPIFTLTTDLIIGAAPPERAGVAAALSETGAEFGGALGIAIFGSVGVAVYRQTLPSDIFANVPTEARAAAVGTLGGAVKAAAELPDALGAALLDGTRSSFLHGVHACAMLSALGAFGLALFTARALGKEPQAS